MMQSKAATANIRSYSEVIGAMNKELETALTACVKFLREFGLGPHEWVLAGPSAHKLNGFDAAYPRSTHFHITVEPKKVPWHTSDNQKDLIQIIPPVDSPFQKR